MQTRLKIEILELLDNLMTGAEHSQTDPDDHSGINTKYTLDSERFRANIQIALTQCQAELLDVSSILERESQHGQSTEETSRG